MEARQRGWWQPYSAGAIRATTAIGLLCWRNTIWPGAQLDMSPVKHARPARTHRTCHVTDHPMILLESAQSRQQNMEGNDVTIAHLTGLV